MTHGRLMLCLAVPFCALVGCDRSDKTKPPSTATETPKEQTAKVVTPPPPAEHQAPIDPAIPLADQPPVQPDQPSLRQRRARIVGEIVQLIGEPAGGLDAEQWKIFKQHYWTASLDQPARKSRQGVGPPSVKDLLAVPSDKEPLIAQIATGNFTDVTDKAEQEFLLASHMLAMTVAAGGGTSLPVALADRRDSPEVTRGDLFMFEVFNDAFADVARRGEPAQAELDQWKLLARSPNGLYRLLALRTFQRVAPKPEQWLNFYRLYNSERDHGILEEAVDLIFQTARPEAATLLSEIRVRTGGGTNPEMVGKLDRSIEWLRKLPPQAQ